MTKIRQFKDFLVFVCVVLVLSEATFPAQGAGFDLPDQDAFAVGRGMAFVATADNPSAIYYNPAGITQLVGNNLRSGIYGIYLEPSFKPPGSNQSFDNRDTYHAVPQFFYTYGKEDSKVSYGFGLYSPFGLGLRWPQDTGFRTLGTKSQIKTTAMNPVVAFKVLPSLSIGGGVSANYVYADLEQGLFSLDQPNDLFQFEGSGWGVSYNVGILWQPHDTISFGASFRSGMTVGLHGHTQTQNSSGPAPIFAQRVDANADQTIPAKVICGVSYRPTPKWNFEFDADYTDWSSLNKIVINQPQSTVLPTSLPFILGWQSSWYYEFGATRYFDNGWHVSAGYIFNENSDPNAHYTPLSADMDRHFFSTGVGHKGKRFDFDLAYQFGYGPTHTVTGSAASAAGQTADGRYSYISHAIAVSGQIHF